MWIDLAKAFGLLLVLEGIMPFLSPARWRNMVMLMARVDDRSMRVIGLVTMCTGAVLLFLVRWLTG